ncbi:MAG: Holliday junction resolvase RuvX [Pseudomonadota bacterium]
MNPPTTVMAFDYGLRQIGVAVGNSRTQTSSAITTLKARDGVPDWQCVEQLIQEWQPELLVVGEPFNMDDSEGELAPRARKFARRLEARFRVPFSMVDERLSSAEAKSQLAEQGHRGDYTDDPADSLAAKLILDTWLGQHGGVSR